MALGIPLNQRVRRLAWRQSRELLPLFRLLGPRAYRRALTRAVDPAYRPLLGRKPPHSPPRGIPEPLHTRARSSNWTPLCFRDRPVRLSVLN